MYLWTALSLCLFPSPSSVHQPYVEDSCPCPDSEALMETAPPAPQRSHSVQMDAPYSLGNLLPVLLFYHPTMKSLADKIATEVKRRKLTDESKGDNVRPVELCDNVKWDSFRDGWPNIFIEGVEKIAGKDVIFLASFHSPEVMFEQLSVIYSFPRYLVRSFRLILPFFPTATMERIDREGQIVTAKTLARMLSIIPFAARGPAQIFIFDIHALQERFYFTDQIIPRLLSAIPYLVNTLMSLPDASNLAIAFPDEGAWKRFHLVLDGWPLITCIKVRNGSDRIVTIKEGDPKDKHVVIVDDLVQTGGTLIECAKALKKNGCTSISMFVTHPVFPKESWKRFTESELGIANFWITDSIPHASELVKHPPFKLISLSESVVDSLLSFDILKYTQ